MGIRLDPKDMFEVFGDSDPTRYVSDVEERWGDSDAYRESRRRVSSYDKNDWLRMRREQTDIEHRFAELLTAGVPADGPDAMDVAEAHRRHIGTWFYDCSVEMHRSLGEMYVEDERFTQHYEQIAPGLARYVRDVVVANTNRMDGRR